MKLTSLITWFCVSISTPLAQGAFTVSVTDPPTAIGGRFKGIVVGPPGHTPNPCYRKTQCQLRMYTISESWLPGGKDRYSTVDTTWASPEAAYTFAWLDEWWDTVTNKSRIAEDYLPVSSGRDPCMVVAAANSGQMVENTIVSNCARGIVQAPDCRVTTAAPDLNFGVVGPGGGGHHARTTLNIQCDGAVTRDIVLSTNTDELIPLSVDRDIFAQLDWGDGFGRPGRVRVSGLANVEVQGRLVGTDVGVADTYYGAAVVNIAYP